MSHAEEIQALRAENADLRRQLEAAGVIKGLAATENPWIDMMSFGVGGGGPGSVIQQNDINISAGPGSGYLKRITVETVSGAKEFMVKISLCPVSYRA